MFVSTSKRIILYDLCNSSVIASCEHCMTKIQKR